jgi:hypothetical protein
MFPSPLVDSFAAMTLTRLSVGPLKKSKIGRFGLHSATMPVITQSVEMFEDSEQHNNSSVIRNHKRIYGEDEITSINNVFLAVFSKSSIGFRRREYLRLTRSESISMIYPRLTCI